LRNNGGLDLIYVQNSCSLDRPMHDQCMNYLETQ
jgi:hypothetical protein